MLTVIDEYTDDAWPSSARNLRADVIHASLSCSSCAAHQSTFARIMDQSSSSQCECWVGLA